MKKHLSSSLLVLLPGGTLAALVVVVWTLLRKLRTGDASLDVLRVRGRVLVELVRARPSLAVRPGTLVELGRACLAIVNNEYSRARELDDQIGDAALGGGPSIGPMQVYRSTAIALGLYSPPEAIAAGSPADRAAYGELAGDVAFCIRAGVRVFLDKLDHAAHGNVAEAIRRYNGGGDASRAYQARALAFLGRAYGAANDNTDTDTSEAA